MSNIEASGDIRSLITTYLERGYAVAEFPFDGVDLRALSSSVGTNVPQKFVQRLTVYERDAAPMLDPAIVSMNAVDRGGEYVFPLLSADAAGGGTVTVEAGGITEADATLSAATAQPYKLASMQLWSNELNTDNVINLEAALARTGGREIGINANALLTTGDGSSKPEGFVTAATNGGTAQGESTDAYFSIWDIADVWYGLPASVRDRSTFMVSSTAMAKITKARDSNGFPVVEQNPQVGSPRTLWGRPLTENAAMAAVASASISVAVGDFSAYEVVRLPVRVELSNHYRFGNDQVALRVIERIDGKLVDTTAIRYMVSADS